MHLRHCLLLLSFAIAPLAKAAVPNTLGNWKTADGSIIHIEPCGPAVCLRVVQITPNAPVDTDTKNPNPSLRSRKLCGMSIGTGFHQDDPTHLSEGQLYDPKSGRTYHGTVVVEGDTLKLRGYVGISLFGRSETWQRTASPGNCR